MTTFKTFKQHLQKTKPVPVFSIEKDIRTVGDLLSSYPLVSNAIKDFVMDNDWEPDDFVRLKSLRISDSFLEGDTIRNGNATTKFAALHKSVIASVSNDFRKDPLKFFQSRDDGMLIRIKDNTRLYVKSEGSRYEVHAIHWGDVNQIVNAFHDNLHDYANYMSALKRTGVGMTIIEELNGWVVFE